MKFLLTAVNAKYIHSNPAVYSLKAYAGRESAEIAEYTINQQSAQILEDIYKRKPEAIAFSCYIWNMEMVERLVHELPKILPGVAIWAGGPEVSYEPAETLQRLPELTGIMVGEGEAVFAELLSHYENNGTDAQLKEIKGLYTKEGYTGVRELLSMDELPFFYDDMTGFENRIIYYETSRGCPFRCSYCLSSVDKTIRLRDLKTVRKELQFFLDRRVPQVKFIDRTFNCNHEHALGIWRYLQEHDNGVTNFHFEIAADILTEKETELLVSLRPGLVQLEIGVQTTNEKTLCEIERQMEMEKFRKTVEQLHDGNNIHIHLDLIAGLPYEDYDSFAKSFCDVYNMEPEQLQLGFLKVLKGSPMYDRAAKYGIYYTNHPPYEVLYSKWISYDKMLRLKQIEEMVEQYYNSGQFTHVLSFLKNSFENPFKMFEALADFYVQKGYFINSPARAYRYEVLLDFALTYDGGHKKIYEELCVYDMYLRENLKSRPNFAPDMTQWYGRIKEFYQQEEKERRYLGEIYEGVPARALMRMTHMEQFDYPVWRRDAQNMEELEEPVCLLFDYQVRSPLTKEARTIVLG